jgi:3-hydroxypropanoate dehydrogenase
MSDGGRVIDIRRGRTGPSVPSLERLLRPSGEGPGFTARPVPLDVLEELHALMAVGPGMSGASPTRLLFLTSPAARARLSLHLPPASRDAAVLAPACALIFYDHGFAEQLMAFVGDGVAGESCFDLPSRLRSAAMRNGVLQGAYLTLSARALGLDTIFFHGFDAHALGGEFFKDASMRAIFAAALGYPAGPVP